MKIKQFVKHILIIAIGVFAIVGIPFMGTDYFASIKNGTDTVTGPSIIVAKPSGNYVVVINAAMHPDKNKLDEWVKFFEGEDVSYIFEDIICSVPAGDQGAIEMAKSFQSLLPENQMKIDEESAILLFSRADERKFDIMIVSEEFAEAYHAETVSGDEIIHLEISGAEEPENMAESAPESTAEPAAESTAEPAAEG